MIRNMLTLIVTPILLAGCLVTPTKSDPNAKRQAFEQQRVACQAMHANLPSQDKYFELKGKITYDTYYREILAGEILQFGLINEYFQYSIDSPNCGGFYLYQIASISRSGDTQDRKKIGTIKFDVTLKNGQSFRTSTNSPFFLHDPKYPKVRIAISGGLENKRLLFRFVTKDPSGNRLAEHAIDHMQIVKLEID